MSQGFANPLAGFFEPSTGKLPQSRLPGDGNVTWDVGAGFSLTLARAVGIPVGIPFYMGGIPWMIGDGTTQSLVGGTGGVKILHSGGVTPNLTLTDAGLLSVRGDIAIDVGSAILFDGQNGLGNTYIYEQTADELHFQVGGDPALILKASGVVSFGTHAAIGVQTVTGYIEIEDIAGTPRRLAVVS